MSHASKRIPWVLILIAASLGPIHAASAEMSLAGCLTITRIQAHDPACQVLVHNGCSKALDLSISYEVSTMRFSKRHLTSLGLDADHHGEAAYGSYEPERTASGTQQGRIGPGESKWFARRNPAESLVVTECRVTVVGRSSS